MMPTTDALLAEDGRAHVRRVVTFLAVFLAVTIVLIAARALVREGIARHEHNPLSHLHGHRIVPPSEAEPFTPEAQRSTSDDTSD